MKVLIIGGNSQYTRMFTERGWGITDVLEETNLVQFCGGADVSPEYYGEQLHPRTSGHPLQDEYEKAIFEVCRADGVPMAGICRGGQFLNVMNGGKMYQDVSNHAIAGVHEAVDVMSGRTIMVSSTHHQMMRPAKHGEIVATASICDRKEYVDTDNEIIKVFSPQDEPDVEVVHYQDTSCLCFQPHPEFSVNNEDVVECADYYFELLDSLVRE